MKKVMINKFACYLGYFSQAIVNNFLPLLFVMFNEKYNVSFSMLAVIALLNFIVQIITDVLSAPIAIKIGYKATGIIGHIFIALGLILLTILPDIMNPVTGIMIAVVLYAFGGGVDEVIISPIMEQQPSKHKAAQMGVLHSAYCFGAAITIVISFFYMLIFGIDKWKYLTYILILFPIIATILFIISDPGDVVVEEKTEGKARVSGKFFTFLMLMLMAGASEAGVGQWMSTYAELGLNAVKPYGDLYGPAFFALTQGISRIIYSILSTKVSIKKYLVVSGFITLLGYLLASLVNNSLVNFIGAIVVGFGVGPLWPGVFSLVVTEIKYNTKLYSWLALAGDIGGGLGTYLIGSIGGTSSIRLGIGIGTSLPIIFIISMFVLYLINKKEVKTKENINVRGNQ